MPLGLFTLAVSAGIAMIGAFWNKVRDWLSTHAASFIGLKFGPRFESAFRECVVLADRAAVAARRMVRTTFIKAQFLFAHMANGSVGKQNVQWLRKPDNPRQVIKRTVTEEMSFEELPEDVKRQISTGGQVSGEMTLASMV